MAARQGMDEEDAIEAVLDAIKAPLALVAFEAWKREKQIGRWVKVAERQPEMDGEYTVIRRGMKKLPNFQDRCTWEDRCWHNQQGRVITSVEKWWEAGEGA